MDGDSQSAVPDGEEEAAKGERSTEITQDSDLDSTLDVDDDLFDLEMWDFDQDTFSIEPAAIMSSATLTNSATLMSSSPLQSQQITSHPENTTNQVEGPEWNLADLDSCPSASQISLGTLDISELSQNIISGCNSDGAVSKTQDGASVTTLVENAAMYLQACAAGKARDGQSALAEKQVSIERSNTRTEMRVVDEMNLPPYVDGKPRQQKIRHWASNGAMRRYGTVTYP
ncbi:hypothetical protein GN244_ATG15240 [Phytophthora infestans]|uniref:Uncharacterized protein n=1 Tax=Phytophthora infestans TaxID=4787 RepID=A0A833SVU8_PHYIN|nr:hypothetical protein GN244_ATG15240 [Phytophthora infestans]